MTMNLFAWIRGSRDIRRNGRARYMYTTESQLQPEQHFNNQFKSIRIVVENVFCSIKKFKICSEKLRVKTYDLKHAKHVHDMAWSSCGGIFNLLHAPLKVFPMEHS